MNPVAKSQAISSLMTHHFSTTKHYGACLIGLDIQDMIVYICWYFRHICRLLGEYVPVVSEELDKVRFLIRTQI